MGSWKEEVTMVHITPVQVEADLQCYICLDDLVAGEEVMKLKCSHHYHELCISPWLDRNSICPTCRQKILCREDPDPEEYDFEFDSGFLTDIIREINNIVYGVESDEEFLYSDSPDIIDLTGSVNQTILFEENFTINERNNPVVRTNIETNVIGDDVENEALHVQEAETEQSILSDASGEETGDHQKEVKCGKRRRSVVEVEDSSDDEDASCGGTVWLLQDVNSNQQSTISGQNTQPMKELVTCSVNRNSQVGNKKKLRKRQRRSPESDESQFSSDEDLEFRSTNNTEVTNRESEEMKQAVQVNENCGEPKRVSNSKTADESHGDESDEGVFVFDMVEVESLVSKLLEIMNQGEDVSNANEDEEDVQSYLEERSKKRALNEQNKENFEISDNSGDEYDEVFSNEDKFLPESAELISKNSINYCNVPTVRPTVERNSTCQRKGNKGNSVKRKMYSSCSSDSESSEVSIEYPVKRKASSSDSESSNDDDSDGFENIEQIISELWSIVGQEGEDSESDKIGVGGNKDSNMKTKEKCLQNKETPKRHKRYH